MRAGVDIGSTLTKCVWPSDEGYRFWSTAEQPLDTILSYMRNDGVKEVNIAGIGKADLQDMVVHRPEGDPIENELKLQVEGLRKIADLPDEFLLVSMGTGTSYTHVGEKIRKFPLGNSIGGGFIRGMLAIIGAEYEGLPKGESIDLLLKEMLSKKGIEGEIVVANMAKGKYDSPMEDKVNGIYNCVTTATIRDLMVMDITDFKSDNIVYIGTTLRYAQLKRSIEMYTSLIGKKPQFPDKGEFPLAMGALHMDGTTEIEPYEYKPRGSLLQTLKGAYMFLRR